MENQTNGQKDLLESLRTRAPDLKERWNDTRGVANSLEGSLLPWQQVGTPDNIIPAFLEQFGPLIGPPDVRDNYVVLKTKQIKSPAVYRAKAYQVYGGLPVYGATLLAFADESRGIFRVQSSFWREIEITADHTVDEDNMMRRLAELLRRDPGGAEFEARWKKEEHHDPWVREHFPLLTRPKLYLYPVEKGFHPAYNMWAYQPLEWVGVDGRTRHIIEGAELMVDAATGEVIWEEPLREGQTYTDTFGDGLSTLQDASGNYLTRNLLIVQDSAGDFLLINRTQTPHIITHDAGGTDTGLVTKLKNDTDISQDADGHWNATTTSCTPANREAAQQPETDCHFYAREAWNFYNGLLSWDGFDGGNWGDHCPVRVVAHIGIGANAYFSKYSEWDNQLSAYKYYGYLAFYDGECVGGAVAFEFMAGDPIIFGHEYQHAITFFGAQKSSGEPGHLYGNNWLGAIREGYSDAIACLRRGLWLCPPFWRDGVLRSGDPFRRVEFPRSTDTESGDWYCDHYDDRDSTKSKYFHSTILSHVAFLVGQGGVHQRVGRSPELIPVKGIGLERTAEIFLYALTQYFDTVPTDQQGPTLIEAGTLLLDAAKDVSGNDKSCEYVTMRRALYAVGLYPYDTSYNKQTYGGEACMLPWIFDWRLSQPYLGFSPTWWRSPDLFINNNGSAQYEASVGQENNLYARVRNIGDQDLNNVKVKFFFAPHGTNLPVSIAGWHPCKDQAGVDCVLDIATLAAGSVNISDPNNPPSDQAVHWYLDPAYVTSDVDHFCVRAVIECTAPNHDHNCPNEVQSNVQYVTADSADAFAISFYLNHWDEEPIPAELDVTHTLPEGFRLQHVGDTPLKGLVLHKGEPVITRWRLTPPTERSTRLEPPFDGKVTAKVTGKITGAVEGQLSKIRLAGNELPGLTSEKQVFTVQGILAGTIQSRKRGGALCGTFEGELDLLRCTLVGRYRGGVSLEGTRFLPGVELTVEGTLEPVRAVHFTQLVKGKPVGGVTVHVKLPPPAGLKEPRAKGRKAKK